MNPGGIRADLIYDSQASGEAPGEVTFGEVFTVQPFQNTLVSMDLTGAQIEQLLEQQFVVNRVLQVSDGFTYSYSASAAVGDKIDPASIELNGVALDPSATYRITANSFIAEGGDGFSVFTQGTNRFSGAVDSEVFADYVGAESPLAPGPQDRITLLP
jgi:5'-nucleotidase